MIVTIVTPTLNGITHLPACLESVRRNQSADIQIEHVIVDGGSTDGTIELAERSGARVIVGKDKGIFDAVNKGSFQSSGALLGFLGADDVMLDGGMHAIVQAYQQGKRPWVVGGIRWIDEFGRDLGGLAAPPLLMTPRMHVCLGWNPIMHMATYFSRDFFMKLGGFDITYRDSGDYELFARARSIAPYTRVARPIACFRRTGENNSAVNLTRADGECRRVRDNFGPASGLERVFWRYTLKSWFNLANPGWLANKLAQPARLRLQLQTRAYF
jgi:glycosyltransferase involved in cell wall biosynthesis